MHGSLVTSSLIRETTENESANEGYRFGQALNGFVAAKEEAKSCEEGMEKLYKHGQVEVQRHGDRFIGQRINGSCLPVHFSPSHRSF
jgi:hypothetical protein